MANGTTLTLSGQLAGLGGLNSTGAGTLALTNSSDTSTGATNICAGTLLVNNTSGSSIGSGGVVVNAGSTLGGNGTISGPVTFNGGTLAVTLGYPVTVNGTANLDNALLTVTGNPTASWYTIIHEATTAVAGTFTGLLAGGLLNVNGYVMQIGYAGGSTGKDVVLNKATFITLNPLTSSSLVNGSNTYTATVSNTFSSNLTPTPLSGTVTFLDNGTPFGTASLSAGVATFTRTGSNPMSSQHTITAVYGGDAHYLGCGGQPGVRGSGTFKPSRIGLIFIRRCSTQGS